MKENNKRGNEYKYINFFKNIKIINKYKKKYL